MIKFVCSHATAECQGKCFCDLNMPHDTAHAEGFCEVKGLAVMDMREEFPEAVR